MQRHIRRARSRRYQENGGLPRARLHRLRSRQRDAQYAAYARFDLVASVHAMRNRERVEAAADAPARRAYGVEQMAEAAIRTVRAAVSLDYRERVAHTALAAEAFAAGATMLGPLPPPRPSPP